jgi:predicted nucleotide-binding protein
MGYNNNSFYDTMQVCLNGHQITSMADSHPEHTKKRCPDCGAETITKCEQCNTKIQGYYHIPGAVNFGETEIQAHCHDCGSAYPWTINGEKNQKKSNSTESALTADIFVVHGHDEEMKQATARTLAKLSLKPIILHEQPNQGRTIIEKFEKNANVQFVIVLLSPDDMAYSSSTSAESASPRARQNVVLELGYFVGRLGRDRVFALKREGKLELPSDFSGIVYTPYDANGKWQFELVKELKAVGYNVDANAIL